MYFFFIVAVGRWTWFLAWFPTLGFDVTPVASRRGAGTVADRVDVIGKRLPTRLPLSSENQNGDKNRRR